MGARFAGVFGIIFLLYIFGNYYVGRRIRQSFGIFMTAFSTKIYWLVFCLLALSPFAGRLSNAYFPGIGSDVLTLVGDYWMGAIYYFVLLWALFDIFRLVAGRLNFNDKFIRQDSMYPGVFVLAVVGILLVYGSLNARNPQIQHYDITIPKAAGDLQELHIVMVSDIHLGSIVDNARLEGLVARINQLQPDLVLIAGDIIDENVNYFAEQRMPETFSRLTPRLGTYACFGNHDYFGGHAELMKDYLAAAGVTVLRDEYVKIDNDFYIVGRDDRSRQRIIGISRKNLAQVVAGIDHSLPIVLLDHQPYELAESIAGGIDLQLSGHTHRGQFFPNNLITHWLYKNDWGYLREKNFQLIVSSGFGTWGPPIRIGNSPEIVDIMLHFSKQ